MKKYGFILWIIVFAAVLGGGYYLSDRLKDKGVEKPVQTISDTPGVSPFEKYKVERGFKPAFTIKNAAGENISLSDYKGQVIILNFWASWCPPCVEEMPELQDIHDSLGDGKVLFAINLTDGQRETREKADKFLAKNGYDMNVLYDTEGKAFMSFGIENIPHTFIIDKEGMVVYSISGETDKATIDALLAMVD
ncbi:MAG: TlpA disulfide reductase family protein [Clostridiaceae bacterium]